MVNRETEYTQNIIEWVLNKPEALGYFPKSTMSGDFNQAPASLSTRKALEENIMLSFYRGNIESIALHADHFDLMFFERYDDYLDGSFDQVSIEKILFKGSHFLRSAKPLEALIKSAVYNRVSGENLDKSVDFMMQMGGKLYKQDQRYLAYAFHRAMHEMPVGFRNSRLGLSEVLGKLAQQGLLLDPAHFEPSQPSPKSGSSDRVRTAVDSMSLFDYWREISLSRNVRHSYLHALLTYEARHGCQLLDPDSLSGIQALEQLVMAYTLPTEDKVLQSLPEYLPMQKMVEALNQSPIQFSNSEKYINSSLKLTNYNINSLLSMLTSVGNGNPIEVRKSLVKSILDSGMGKAFEDKKMQLSMIKHCTRRALSGETEIFSLIRPFLHGYTELGISDIAIFELAKEGNAYGRSEIRRLENTPEANDLLLRVGKSARPELLKWMIDKEVLGASPHMLRLSEHHQIKREVLTSDLGL